MIRICDLKELLVQTQGDKISTQLQMTMTEKNNCQKRDTNKERAIAGMEPTEQGGNCYIMWVISVSTIYY